MFYSVAAVCMIRGMWLQWVDMRETSLAQVPRGRSSLAQEPIKL
jgi:drug/metabolite transporter superfamily protein YnfA